MSCAAKPQGAPAKKNRNKSAKKKLIRILDEVEEDITVHGKAGAETQTDVSLPHTCRDVAWTPSFLDTVFEATAEEDESQLNGQETLEIGEGAMDLDCVELDGDANLDFEPRQAHQVDPPVKKMALTSSLASRSPLSALTSSLASRYPLCTTTTAAVMSESDYPPQSIAPLSSSLSSSSLTTATTTTVTGSYPPCSSPSAAATDHPMECGLCGVFAEEPRVADQLRGVPADSHDHLPGVHGMNERSDSINDDSAATNIATTTTATSPSPSTSSPTPHGADIEQDMPELEFSDDEEVQEPAKERSLTRIRSSPALNAEERRVRAVIGPNPNSRTRDGARGKHEET